MFINHNGITCYVSKIDQPRIWYHIWIDIQNFGNNYIKEKLGVTDPHLQQKLQDKFRQAIKSHIQQSDLLEAHNLRLDKTDYPFYLAEKSKDSVTVFMEKGLFTLGEGRPLGYPWAVIHRHDTPEKIQAKLYDHRKRFGVAMHKKLRKIYGW
jgi:hypothetical protein